MGLTYKVVQFRATKHHGADAKHSEHWDSFSEYDRTEKRFCIVSTETGEILDDAQGYGYKTAQKAYAGFAYKNRDKSKDKERQAKKKHIETWMKEHKSFIRLMDACAFDIIKGAAAPDDIAMHPLSVAKRQYLRALSVLPSISPAYGEQM